APNRYYCPKCNIVHCGGCALTVIPTENEMQKTRPCKDCRATAAAGGKQAASKRRQPQDDDDDDDDDGAASRTGQGRAKKKGKAGDSPKKKKAVNPLPTSPGAENDVMVARRIASTCIHESTPLSSGFSDQDVGVLQLENGLAKLVFIPLGLHDHLLQENPSAQVHMKGLLYHVCKELLHPEGTVLVSLPVPIYKHQRCIVEHLQQPGLGMVVEDHGLVVEYGSRVGGLTAESKKKFIGGALDHYIVAHHNASGDGGVMNFTCNDTVTPQSFTGRLSVGSRDPSTWSTASDRRIPSPLMGDVPHKGVSRGYHDNVAKFAIQRWTKAGDTVVSMHAESDGVVECALNLGRKVEAFLAASEHHPAVTARIEEAWEGAWRRGLFAVDGDSSKIMYISHGSLPDGIPEITTPHRILADVNTRITNLREGGVVDGTTTPDERALLGAAQAFAEQMGWAIKVNSDDNLPYLCARAKKSYQTAHNDIPVWGKAVVYDSHRQALDSLNIGDHSPDLQFVRLVRVADNGLLKKMCPNNQVVKHSEAGLYLHVAESCPAYYACCEQGKDKSSTHHEISSYLQRTDDREKLISYFKDDVRVPGYPAPVRLVVTGRIAASNPGAAVYVDPGVSVICAPTSDPSSSSDQGLPEGSDAGGEQDVGSGV
ncbi:unnamed protein product, partial [Ectocarpus sp. 8 AP-2014]